MSSTFIYPSLWLSGPLVNINSFCFTGELLSAKADFFRYSDVSLVLRNAGLVLLGAVLAFFLEFSEFLLLANTSSLTLSIAGIFKVSVDYIKSRIKVHMYCKGYALQFTGFFCLS